MLKRIYNNMFVLVLIQNLWMNKSSISDWTLLQKKEKKTERAIHKVKRYIHSECKFLLLLLYLFILFLKHFIGKSKK